VVVSGWKELPEAGDEVLQGSEDDVKKAVQNRLRRVQLDALLRDAEAINAQRRRERERKEEEKLQQRDDVSSRLQLDSKQLRLVIKADVSGSAEALSGAAEGIGNKLVSTKIITSGAGEVTESDVAMAKAVGGESFSTLHLRTK
jgi:translation initiation factor IF-2